MFKAPPSAGTSAASDEHRCCAAHRNRSKVSSSESSASTSDESPASQLSESEGADEEEELSTTEGRSQDVQRSKSILAKALVAMRDSRTTLRQIALESTASNSGMCSRVNFPSSHAKPTWQGNIAKARAPARHSLLQEFSCSSRSSERLHKNPDKPNKSTDRDWGLTIALASSHTGASTPRP